MRIENLTGHGVAIVDRYGKSYKYIGKSGEYPPIRLEEKDTQLGYIKDVPVFKKEHTLHLSYSVMKELENIPILVSSVTANELKSLGYNGDVYVPFGKVKDDDGNILGCTCLQKVIEKKAYKTH